MKRLRAEFQSIVQKCHVSPVKTYELKAWWKRRSAEYGVRSAEYGVRSAEYGVRSAEYGVRSAECGVRSAEYGVRSAESVSVKVFL